MGMENGIWDKSGLENGLITIHGIYIYIYIHRALGLTVFMKAFVNGNVRSNHIHAGPF